jgi:hypothetical protein
MNDYDLVQLFAPIIESGLLAQNIKATVVQGNMPRQEGAEKTSGAKKGNEIIFTKITDHRNGYPLRLDVYNNITDSFDHTEIQYYEAQWQVNALVIQNPKTPTMLTASDVLNMVSLILQTSDTVTTLNNADVGIYRITDVRNPYFKDDRDRFQASPSFDFILNYKRAIIIGNPKISAFEYNLFPI